MPSIGGGGTPRQAGEFNPFTPGESRAASDGTGSPAQDGPAPPILVTSPKFGLQYEVAV